MTHRTLLVGFAFTLVACGSAVPPRQADGSDCNYAESATACGDRSYCDPGPVVPGRGYARSRTYGLLGDKTHVVGTCRPKGAAGAACDAVAACLSGRCTRALSATQGTCE